MAMRRAIFMSVSFSDVAHTLRDADTTPVGGGVQTIGGHPVGGQRGVEATSIDVDPGPSVNPHPVLLPKLRS
jgi:hypothetical protein